VEVLDSKHIITCLEVASSLKKNKADKGASKLSVSGQPVILATWKTEIRRIEV
jgi:hypothetical protein